MVSPPQNQSTSTYEGRVLPRPDEELVDQGLGFDVGTLLSRRRLLGLLGIGAATVGLAACGARSQHRHVRHRRRRLVVGAPRRRARSRTRPPARTPATAPTARTSSSRAASCAATSGPASATPSGTAEGVPMTLELTITDLANGGSAVRRASPSTSGTATARAATRCTPRASRTRTTCAACRSPTPTARPFTSIFPACYSGRWPHIHFEVYPDQSSITDSTNGDRHLAGRAARRTSATTVYATSGYEASVGNLAQVSLDSDNVFGDDGGVSQLGTVTGGVDQRLHGHPRRRRRHQHGADRRQAPAADRWPRRPPPAARH